MVFMKAIMNLIQVHFLSYIEDENLRRIVVDIEMMSINEEISESGIN